MPQAHDHPPNSTDIERVRREFLSIETSIKVLGGLVLIGAASSLAEALRGLGDIGVDTLIAAGVGGLGLATGAYLLKLEPLGRILFSALVAVRALGVIMQGIEQQALPVTVVGLVIPALFLLMLWGKRGSCVFTTYYRTVVVPQTAQIRYKVNWLSVLVLLLIVFVFAVFAVGIGLSGWL